jgi:integrase
MTLQELVVLYPTLRVVSPSCLRNYRKHVTDLERFADRQLNDVDVTCHLVSAWLTSKLRAGCSPYYVSSLRSSILAVWKLARELDSNLKPLSIAIVRRPDLLVRVWSPHDVMLLSKRASQLPGKIGGLYPRGEYLSTLILAAWYSGLRRSDIHRIRRENVSADGFFPFVQHKNGRRKACWIPPEVIARVTWTKGRGPLWPRPGRSDEIVRNSFRALVLGIACERPDFYVGCWKDIRRSAEDSAENRHPGKGHEHAGHERRTYEKFYAATKEKPDVLPDRIL